MGEIGKDALVYSRDTTHGRFMGYMVKAVCMNFTLSSLD